MINKELKGNLEERLIKVEGNFIAKLCEPFKDMELEYVFTEKADADTVEEAIKQLSGNYDCQYRQFYILPISSPFIKSTREEIRNFLNFLNANDIVAAYRQEKGTLPESEAINGGENVFTLIELDAEQQASFSVNELKLLQYLDDQIKIGIEPFIDSIEEVLVDELPVVDEVNDDRIAIYSSEDARGSKLLSANQWLRNISSKKKKEKSKKHFISVEGAQGSGKTTQAQLIYNAAKSKGIPIGYPLSKEETAVQILKEFEALTGALLPFSVRQNIVRDFLKQYYDYANQQYGLIVNDRSPYSALMTHFTTRNICRGASEIEHKADIRLLHHWLKDNPGLIDIPVIVFLFRNIFQGFFRMRKDNSVDNQSSDLFTQIRENIFYRTLASSGRAHLIESIENKKPEEILREILETTLIEDTFTSAKERYKSPESMRLWLTEKHRIAVWFSTRLFRNLGSPLAEENAKRIVDLMPDIVLVGASEGISSQDQKAALETCMEARIKLGVSDRLVKIFDASPRADFLSDIRDDSDISLIFDPINTSKPDLHKQLNMNVRHNLYQLQKPLFNVGYLLFDNGKGELPTVAHTFDIPLPYDRGSLYKGAARALIDASTKYDILFLDAGSNPIAPLPSNVIAEAVTVTRDAAKGSREPLIWAASGITKPEHAIEFLQKGVDGIVIGTVFESNPESAKKIVNAVKEYPQDNAYSK